MGGVLFIDEAYYLYRPENERDYGQEAIEILLQVMENQRDDLVVILAGYKDRMDTFFASNPGMSSRIAHHIDFPDYSADELVAIARLMIAQMNYRLAPDAETTLLEYITRRMMRPNFANARSIRNALDRARLRHASRLFAGPATNVSRARRCRRLPPPTSGKAGYLPKRSLTGMTLARRLDRIAGGPPCSMAEPRSANSHRGTAADGSAGPATDGLAERHPDGLQIHRVGGGTGRAANGRQRSQHHRPRRSAKGRST